ncbi:MAG: branched-chain amino acid transport system II carrier protein [Chlamydiia bacterium]|nr:branched-chain amino acid transport system II carrier protein [Chlamydiia bacterium]
MKCRILTTGFALFSMFFGAGNLIFPLLIGKAAGDEVGYALAGLGITAVLVPFLGLAAMILYNGDAERFFGRFGFAILLLLQLILGPFGVIPRLVTLMHAMISSHVIEMPLMLFSLLAGGFIFLCSFERERLIGFLGAFLTPILIASIIALTYFGLTTPAESLPTSMTASESFWQGLLGGYNTMDLIAAFLFATVILPHFQDEPKPLRALFLSGAIAATLLFLTYVSLCLIAVRHSALLTSAVPPEQTLGAIAVHLLGKTGGLIAAIAAFTACLTTAMTLASIFAGYLSRRIFQHKIGPTSALALTLMMTALMANLGFSGLAGVLNPLLQVLYPCLIALTFINLRGSYDVFCREHPTRLENVGLG